MAAPKRKGGAANTRLRAQVAARRKARANVAPPAASIVIDVNSGAVLHADNADSHRHPASLTKVMTLYLLFERMQAGTLTPDQPLSVSEHAAAQPPTKLRLKAGETITV
ncbi:MAG: hypothetical protein HY056_13605, partial [Proteobacteria bacterium]|nr:hypothetical protein [Pseudomonadota bacterium]